MNKNCIGINFEDFKILKYITDIDEFSIKIRNIRNKFGFYTNVNLYVYDSIDEISRTLNVNIPKWVTAMAVDDVIFISDYSVWKEKDNTTFDKVIIHEFIHVIINNSIKSKVPLWINEGIAQYYSEEYKKYKLDGRELEKDIYALEVYSPSLYKHSAQTVKLLIDKYGEKYIINKIKNTYDFENDKILGAINIKRIIESNY